tara:strand:+ start:766 stop:909 length:144 start_codon:yes stop_codon:yes gene_type:complete
MPRTTPIECSKSLYFKQSIPNKKVIEIDDIKNKNKNIKEKKIDVMCI